MSGVYNLKLGAALSYGTALCEFDRVQELFDIKLDLTTLRNGGFRVMKTNNVPDNP